MLELRSIPPPGTEAQSPLFERLWTAPDETNRCATAVLLPDHPEAIPAGPFGGMDVAEQPGVTRSLWSPPGTGADTLLEIEVLDCTSLEAAHENLLGVLAQFQSPLFRRDDELNLGDVAFRGPTSAVLAFARANLVYLLRNRGARVVPVLDAARGCDDVVTARPQVTAGGAAALHVELVEVPTKRRVARVDVEAAVAAPPAPTALAASPVLGKAFTRTGELRRERGELTYQPTQEGPGSIDFYLAHASGAEMRRRLRVPAA